MGKYVPSEEQLKSILARYDEIHNYAQVGREFGISGSIVARLVKESSDRKSGKRVYVYEGSAPLMEDEKALTKSLFYWQLLEFKRKCCDVQD